MKVQIKAKRFFRVMRKLVWYEQLIVLESIALSALVRLIIIMIPFKWIFAYLEHESILALPNNADLLKARRIALAIRFFSAYFPWRALCLEQAIVGKLMLRRRHIPSTLFLGVNKGSQTMQAHAWLTCGEERLTGGDNCDEYSIISIIGGAN